MTHSTDTERLRRLAEEGDADARLRLDQIRRRRGTLRLPRLAVDPGPGYGTGYVYGYGNGYGRGYGYGDGNGFGNGYGYGNGNGYGRGYGYGYGHGYAKGDGSGNGSGRVERWQVVGRSA